MNELIEKLKDKNYVRAFGLMSEEEQECFKKVRSKNCVKLVGMDSIPFNIAWVEYVGSFNGGYTYAIKSDYKPEPEFVDLEIEIQPSPIGKHVYDKLGCVIPPFEQFVPNSELKDLPNFVGFYLNTGDKQTEVRPEYVARYCPDVVARFRKV